MRLAARGDTLTHVGIDTLDPAYYTVADGDEYTKAARAADVDVGATQDLPRRAGHRFYARLNKLLDQHDFDGYVEGLCERFSADDGRPGLPPGREGSGFFRQSPE